MQLDPTDRATSSLRSFIRILGGELNTLREVGVDCENLEYLKVRTAA